VWLWHLSPLGLYAYGHVKKLNAVLEKLEQKILKRKVTQKPKRPFPRPLVALAEMWLSSRTHPILDTLNELMEKNIERQKKRPKRLEENTPPYIL